MESNDGANEVVQNLSFDELAEAVDRANRVVKLVGNMYVTAGGQKVFEAIDYQQSGSWCLIDGFLKMYKTSYESRKDALEVAREMIEASPEYEIID